MVGEIRSISIVSGEEIAMFGCVVERSDGGGLTMFTCIGLKVGVHKGFRRVRFVRLGGERPCPLP
jgi:hypothetical protein